METRKQRKARLAQLRRTSAEWSKRNHRSSYMGIFYRFDWGAVGHSGHQEEARRLEAAQGKVVFLPRGGSGK